MTETRDFTYRTRDLRVVFADGALAELGDAIDTTLEASRCMLVTTPRRTDVIDATREVLGDRMVSAFVEAKLHVPAAVVEDAVDQLRVSDPDCVVAIGGGSAIGLGKALVKDTALPLVAVPTTYSGSEMTEIWGVTEGDRKQTGRDPRAAPRLVVYDPRLTHTMPSHVTTTSGMNAIAHSVEALYSQTRSPVTSMLAADGIRRLAHSLPILVRQPRDAAARWNALCGAHLCGRALDMTSMGLHHKVCHVLGGTLNLPHALTHAIILPHVVAYNAKIAFDAMAKVASILGASDAAHGLWQLNRTLGITQTLADLGVAPEDIDGIVQQVAKASYPNPAPITKEGVRHLLERAMTGKPPA